MKKESIVANYLEIKNTTTNITTRIFRPLMILTGP